MRAWIIAKRNLKELSRDPLGYVFCIAFPILLLGIFQIISYYSGHTFWFELYRLAPGICVFSFSFVMLYMALLVSKDRCTSFLERLYTTPTRTSEFVVGYAIPGVLIGIVQTLFCYLSAVILLLVTGSQVGPSGITGSFGVGYDAMGAVLYREVLIPWSGMLLSVLALLPTLCMFVGLGILLGSLFSDKSAPGVSSAIVSLSGFVSGIWMPLETMGGFETVCRFLPFYPAVLVGRTAFLMETPNSWLWVSLGTVCLYAVLCFVAAVWVFRRKMNSDRRA